MAAKALKRIIGAAEVGAYQHVYANGHTVHKMYNATNSSLRVDAAPITREIGRVRLEFSEVEDGSVKDQGNVNYTKELDTIQLGGMGSPQTGNIPYNSGGSGDPPKPAEGLSGIQVMKNMIDNILADKRLIISWLIAIGLIAVAALVMAALM